MELVSELKNINTPSEKKVPPTCRIVQQPLNLINTFHLAYKDDAATMSWKIEQLSRVSKADQEKAGTELNSGD